MSGSLPPIKGYLPSSLIEWEGRVACAVFLPRCNFRCPFCHAGRLVLTPDELGDMSLESILSDLHSRRGWIDGAVVSGGEPTLHEGLPDLIDALREHVRGVKLDTNGSRPAAVRDLIERRLVDFVAMDIKAPLGEAYRAAAGVEVDCSAIAETVDLLRADGVGHEFRTTVVPGLHKAEDVVAIARFLGRNERLVLQQFAPLNCLDPSFLERRPYDRRQLREMAAAASDFVGECKLRGDASACGART